ncbi:MAG: hypothetical protein QGD94_05815 [Planctomycetia bacterium]|nr:hypothetical protein [Planctomycetia bacterium]
MKTHHAKLALVVLVLAAGCFKFEITPEINLGEGSGGESAPAQVPENNSKGSWRDIAADIAGKVFLGAEKGAIFYAYDTLAYPAKPVDLVAELQSTKNLKGVRGVTIGFYREDKRVGAAKTDKNGRATLRWTPPKPGDYSFTAKVDAVGDEDLKKLLEVTPAPLLVACRSKDTQFAVVDLDHTVVGSGFFRVLLGGAEPMADSARVMHKIARKYSIIYLTHRPNLLTRKSKVWLKDQGFPAGPLLVSRLSEAFGDSGKFKTAKLALVKKAYPNIKIGIGDKLSDAETYVKSGLRAYLIPHYKQKPEDMRKTAKAVRRLRGRGRLDVVENWKEIESAIFSGRKFPQKDFARRLGRRADTLEKEERKRKKEDDDD